jgi:hypothetical protein
MNVIEQVFKTLRDKDKHKAKYRSEIGQMTGSDTFGQESGLPARAERY